MQSRSSANTVPSLDRSSVPFPFFPPPSNHPAAPLFPCPAESRLPSSVVALLLSQSAPRVLVHRFPAFLRAEASDPRASFPAAHAACTGALHSPPPILPSRLAAGLRPLPAPSTPTQSSPNPSAPAGAAAHGSPREGPRPSAFRSRIPGCSQKTW